MQAALFLNDIQSKSDFKTEDFAGLLSFFEIRKFDKNVHLFRANEHVKNTYFILRGCMRQYYINSEGNERVIYFATEGKWCGDSMSQFFDTPSSVNMETMEECEAIVATRDGIKAAFLKFPEFSWYIFMNRILTVEKFKNNMGRDTIETPLEKYIRFTQQQPDLIQRIPQYQIAAYLGITPETLSRIRKKIAQS